MKGIYLPTFQRSIILRANEGYTTFTQLFTQLDNHWREKRVSLLVSLYICDRQILPCIHLDSEIIAVMVLTKGINKF